MEFSVSRDYICIKLSENFVLHMKENNAVVGITIGKFDAIQNFVEIFGFIHKATAI